jgi:tryptophan 2,3-dioxygenase
MADPYDPSREGAQMAFDGRMSYGDYLRLDAVLGAQAPLSDAHDELLFIIQHQTSELWMKLMISELAAAREDIAGDRLAPALKLLSRVSRIMEQLNSAWDVLRTMTPADYTTFRKALGQSSGFQSHQYRQIEFILGNRNRAMMRPHAHLPQVHATLQAELDQPSLYGTVLGFAARQGMTLPGDVTVPNDRPHAPRDEVQAMWKEVYDAPGSHWQLYELAEKLMDLEDYFRRWRFNHVTTVERVIGLKKGTGGTGGVSYLRHMLEVVLFPELWTVRTEL